MLVEEKMMENKYLITVTNKELLDLKVKNVNFLFPIQKYCVGYRETFNLEEINLPNSYIFLNRIFDDKSIMDLKKDLENINSNIIGICFTDLGVLQVVKELNLNLKLIYMQSHNTTNYVSINYYLEDVDSVLISTDITNDEIMNILDKSNKPLVVPYFGLADAMYSRRKLLSNFQEEFAIDKNNLEVLKEPISNMEFKVVENEYGTMFFANKYIDYRSIKHDNILFYYINPIGLDKNMVNDIINGVDMSEISDSGFLNKETIYRLKEL